jgi:hypothetical protein
MNHSAVAFSSASYIGTKTQDKQANDYYRGIKAYLNLSVKGSTSVTFGVYGYDYLGNVVTVGELTASATGIFVLTVYPALLAASGVINNVLPRNWFLKVTPSDATANTYSLCFDLFA